MKNILLGLALLFVATSIYAQDDSGGIIYGDNWAYIVSPPKGWILDSSSWANRGIYGLFYKKGTEPKVPNPIIYINSVKLKKDTDEELEIFIRSDLKQYIADKNNEVIELNPRETKYGKPVRIFKLDISNRQYELIAYYKQKETVHMIVLATFGKKEFKENEDAFYFIVDSLSLTDKK
ncbi:MAG: hypothetical protein JXD23_12585 [Spirochaetales bacterium]|nr:hypothetical protein [Spirochaetales bacterium]